MTDPTDAALADAAAELYAADLDEFTSRRNALASEADDRGLANRIRKLPKPVAAAWLLNQLAHRDPDRVDELAWLGERIAAAQERLDADELRATARERSSLIPEVTRRATDLAAELGRPASGGVARDVERTLEAAVVNPAVADAVRSGQLTKAPLAPDAPDDEVEAALALSRAAPGRAGSANGASRADGEARRGKRRKADSADELARRRRAKAEKSLAEAEAAAEHASHVYEQLVSRLDHAQDRRDDLADEKHELERRLRDVTRRLESLDDDIATLEADRSEAHTRRQQAKRDLRKARRARDELAD